MISRLLFNLVSPNLKQMLIITFQMILFKRQGSVKRPWSKNCGNNFSEADFKGRWGWVHNLVTLENCRIAKKKLWCS